MNPIVYGVFNIRARRKGTKVRPRAYTHQNSQSTMTVTHPTTDTKLPPLELSHKSVEWSLPHRACLKSRRSQISRSSVRTQTWLYYIFYPSLFLHISSFMAVNDPFSLSLLLFLKMLWVATVKRTDHLGFNALKKLPNHYNVLISLRCGRRFKLYAKRAKMSKNKFRIVALCNSVFVPA